MLEILHNSVTTLRKILSYKDTCYSIKQPFSSHKKQCAMTDKYYIKLERGIILHERDMLSGKNYEKEMKGN